MAHTAHGPWFVCGTRPLLRLAPAEAAAAGRVERPGPCGPGVAPGCIEIHLCAGPHFFDIKCVMFTLVHAAQAAALQPLFAGKSAISRGGRVLGPACCPYIHL